MKLCVLSQNHRNIATNEQENNKNLVETKGDMNWKSYQRYTAVNLKLIIYKMSM